MESCRYAGFYKSFIISYPIGKGRNNMIIAG